MHFSYFYLVEYDLAWIFRFMNNVKGTSKNATEYLLRTIIQQEVFRDENNEHIRALNPFRDESGVIRLKTRVCRRDDTDNFRFPIVLPANHIVVRQINYGFTYTIVPCRNPRSFKYTSRKILDIGWSQNYKKGIIQMESPPLPVDRVRDAAIFEVTGVDFAGPLYLKSGEKAWVCLFTSAVQYIVQYTLNYLLLYLHLVSFKFFSSPVRFVFSPVDCDAVEKVSFCRKIRYNQKLREDLSHRFRNEYLGQLKLLRDKKPKGKVSLGEVVLIGNDNTKRLDWPIARGQTSTRKGWICSSCSSSNCQGTTFETTAADISIGM
ncbi:hypothetical protein NQ317_018464 [Molorchus minor]|uniref:DUF5641 domain-containing protein n=1 Tax=Molorchus minor TaxID=1323400 RepID=A0ABQ9JGY8_9CUCU|nr:hypothetical protein NQ317_018464 [Molorchus minor]